MDFARKQLEKYGWSDGKGLGKHENGIPEAIKPKLKRSVTGVGHDPAADFNEHWWRTLYDKAASNVEVKEKNGKTKKIKTKDDFEITNSIWKINKKKKSSETHEEYGDYFVRTEVMSGGSKAEKVRDSDSEEETMSGKRDVFQMTDEELFAACGGRTAHKGARHGLKAIGKLARIERQEQILLNESRYNGYSHAKKIKKEKNRVRENVSLNSDSDFNQRTDSADIKKKKKKLKRCITSGSNETSEKAFSESVINDDMDCDASEQGDNNKQSNKPKEIGLEINIDSELCNGVLPKKKKKKKDKVMDCIEMETESADFYKELVLPEKIKKIKRSS